MSVRVHVASYIHVYTHVFIFTFIYTVLHAHVDAFIRAYLHVYIYAFIFTFMHVDVDVFLHFYICIFIRSCSCILLHFYSSNHIHALVRSDISTCIQFPTCTCCCISAFWHADFCISVFLHFCISAFVACTNLLPVPAASGRQPRQAAASCRSAVLYPKKHNALIFICIYAHIYISIYAYLHSGGGEAWLARIARWPCNLWGAAENYIGGTSSGGSISGRCGGFTSTLLPFASTMPAAARHGVDPVCHASCCSFTLMLMVFYLQGLSRNGYGVLFNISINLSVEMCLYLFKCGNVKI